MKTLYPSYAKTLLIALLFLFSKETIAQDSSEQIVPTISSYTFRTTSGSCVSGTVNRFTGSYHSNLYIGNNSGTNVLLQWGQNMRLYITGSSSPSANDTTPTVVSASSYAGVPLEVRSSSSGGASGYSAMVLRTSTNLYVFGTAANITAITTMASFGGASLTTAASDVSSKLPSWISVSNISQMAVSQTAFAIVTADSGRVYVLTTVANLQGDSATASSVIWHQVRLSGGVTPLSGVTKFSLSSSGAFALTSNGKIYYWGSPANVNGTANTTTSYKCAYDMSSQIPAGLNVIDLVVLGTKTPSSSTLYLLCSNNKVYASGLNTNGCLGNPGYSTSYSATSTAVAAASVTSSTSFTVTSKPALTVGNFVTIYNTGNTSQYINGTIKSYSASTGALTITPITQSGATSNTAWTVTTYGTTTATNQATFTTVKDTTGITDLTNIVKIDGDTEADIFCMAAMDNSGNIFGWGDSPAAILGLPLTGASTSSFPVPRTVRLFNGGSSPATGYTDFSVAGHFTISFYTNGSTDQYWYLGHNSGGSIGDPSNANAYIIETSPSPLNATGGVSFDCSNTQPTITVTGTLSAFSSCNSSASASQTITVSGQYLSSNITITAPTGYEVSTSSGSGYGSTATLTQSGGNVNNTTIYIRLTSSATNGASGNIACTSTGATEQDIATGAATVNNLPTVISVTGASRTGTGTLTLSGTASAGAILDWYAASTGSTVLSGGSGTLSFITPSISTTTNYFAEARNTTTGCVSSNRSLVTATINGSFSAGTIGADQSICNGSTSAGITSLADASGGTGTITYQWQSSADNISYNDISGATLTYYTALSPLTQTTYYRRAATTTTDGTTYSNYVTVTVNALPTASNAVNNSRTGAGPVIISASASSGATLDWYANATGGSVLSGGNGVTTFTTPSISVTTTYYAQARNSTTGCLSSSRIPVVATINGSFSPGSVSADQSVCSGSTASGFASITDASGGTGTITNQWQSSTDNVTFNDIPGATSTTYSPSSLTQTTYFRRAATTSTDGTIYSNVVTITVNPLPNTAIAVDGSRSGEGCVVINVTVNGGETADWYDVPSGGSILSGGTGTTSFTTPSIPTTTDYYAQARNATSQCNSASRTTVIAAINSPLPVTILNFTARKADNTVLLNWSTASEQNSKDFQVQFSTDGQNWTTVGIIAAAGNSTSIQEYSFVHANPVYGINYYRLLQQDLDGRSTYSKVISIIFTSQTKVILVYPNPVVDGILNLQLQNATVVSLYDNIGKLVLRQQLFAGAQQLDVSKFAKGLYQLKAGEETLKIIIR